MEKVANIEQITEATYRSYRCTNMDYDGVVAEVAKTVHDFLFCGMQNIDCTDYGYENDERLCIKFPTVEGIHRMNYDWFLNRLHYYYRH